MVALRRWISPPARRFLAQTSAALAALAVAVAAHAGAELGVVKVTEAGYPEGPTYFEGALHYVEYSAGTIRVLDRTGSRLWWHSSSCGPSGLAVYRQHLLVACYDSNELIELDGAARETARYSKEGSGATFRGPNDFTADGHGGVYFSASGDYDVHAPITGAILHLAADGRLRRVADTIHYPNGLTLDADGRHLLVAEMLAGRVLSFDVLGDGGLGARTVWARLEDLAPPTRGADAYNGPDGLKRGPDGCYYIAQNGSGRVLVVNPQRERVAIITVPVPYVTNIGFLPDGTGYITATSDEWHPPYPGAVYRRAALGAPFCARPRGGV